MTEQRTYVQVAPYPHDLRDLVAACRYRIHEGWTVRLSDDLDRDKDRDNKVIGHGLTLVITTEGYDAYHPERGETYRVAHYFIVPAATYNRESWQRWLFERCLDVERHECMENFVLRREGPCVLADGTTADHSDYRPFAPTHGKGDDPYVVHEYADDLMKRARFTEFSDQA